MKTFMLCGVFMALVGLAQPANAQTQGLEVQVTVTGHTSDVAGSSSEHFLTFSAPVGVPGVSLPAGTYAFRFVTPSVIQVLNEARSIAYAMFFVTPVSRSEATDDYAVSLWRGHRGAPARIATLFLPGASTGYEPTYPKVETAGVAEQVAMK